MNQYISLGLYLGALLFQAGIFYASVRGLQRDVNGLGNKLREIERKQEERFQQVVLAMVSAAPEKQKAQIVSLLLKP